MTPLDRFLRGIADYVARQPDGDRFALVLIGADRQTGDMSLTSPLTNESIEHMLGSALSNLHRAPDTRYRAGGQ
jgi:hypothetical protein